MFANPGDGYLVTTKFIHENAEILDLRIEGSDEPIGTTASHPFWSEDRQEFVPAGELRIGENMLLADDTPRKVESLTRRETRETVYNIEVDGEHVFHVGNDGVLVHNSCDWRMWEKQAGHYFKRKGFNVVFPAASSRIMILTLPGNCCMICSALHSRPVIRFLSCHCRRIGPHLRSTAIYLRNVIGISYRKIPRVIEEMFGITFTRAALIGFETMLAEKAKPIVDDIAKKPGSSDGAVHADETYWSLNGERAYYWVHCDARFAHFQFDTSRCGQVSRDVLGEH